MDLTIKLPSMDLNLPARVDAPASRPLVVRYVFTIAILVLALVVRWLLNPYLGERHPFTTFYAAVTIAAWFGGFGPALLASVVGWALADWLFTPPLYEFAIRGIPDLVGVITFLFVGLAVASFSGAMHSARRRAEDAAAELGRYSDHLEDMVRLRTAELRQSYERLRASERLAMMGMLSAGMGHDLGNLLMACRGRLNALAARSTTGDAEADIAVLREVMSYLERLVRTMRRLATDPDRADEREATSVPEWWQECEALLHVALPRGVTLQAEIADGLPRAKIAASTLTQIAFNLVHNAGAVLKGRRDGCVRIEVARTAGERPIVLRISDNGPGMSADVKDHCLEPFFTTGTTPHSTGLGLALVNHLVQQCEGTLEIESTPNQGTTFIMHFKTIAPAPPACAIDG